LEKVKSINETREGWKPRSHGSTCVLYLGRTNKMNCMQMTCDHIIETYLQIEILHQFPNEAITFKRKPIWEIFMMKIRDTQSIICHTNKAYWWMFITKKGQVEL
jgi:hypothetical protein